MQVAPIDDGAAYHATPTELVEECAVKPPHATPSALKPSSTAVIPASPMRNVSFADSPRLAQPMDSTVGAAVVVMPSPSGQESVLSGTDYGWEGHSDDQSSMSGYSAYSGGGASGTAARRVSDTEGSLGQANTYYMRLVRFYKKYNPEKLSRAEEFLAAYKGEEEQLFKILVQKYGSEPAPEDDCGLKRSATEEVDSKSDNGSMIHFAGARWVLPKTVSAAQGRTDVETPYWPGNRLIADTDLLSLLRNLRTDNEELGRCFVGVLAHHPATSFNGLVYVTKAPLQFGGDSTSKLFLGHRWAGSLANNKTLVHQHCTYARTVLHCTEECRKDNPEQGPHERWRLTVYRSEGSLLALYRAMWDPLLDQEPTGGAGTSQGDRSSGPSALGKVNDLVQQASSNAEAREHYPPRRRPQEQPIQPPADPPPRQRRSESPSELSSSTAVKTLVQSMLNGFESRIIKKLVALEERVSTLERRLK